MGRASGSRDREAVTARHTDVPVGADAGSLMLGLRALLARRATSSAPIRMIVHSRDPTNAETPPDRLRASFITDARDFYVRSHGDVPRLAETTHVLRVGGRVATPLELDLATLRARFAPTTLTAAMQCAGNRRADLQGVRPTSGDPWGPGAIGNAEWTGVRLADLLREAGADGDPALHVAFASADTVAMPGEGRFRYGVSIPIAKAMAPETLIAWAMNGAPLTAPHGAPLRAVVPGFAGVRSAKWLTAITVQAAPSDNHMQQRDYKLLPPDVTAETVDWDRGIVINAMPLTSAICEPRADERLAAGAARVRGYAIASARRVTRVDVSADGGRQWAQATIEPGHDAPWSWIFWETVLALAAGPHELVVRAWDDAGQTQPSRPEDVWNFKGYLGTAWHRVPVMAV